MKTADQPIWVIFVGICLMVALSSLPKLLEPKELITWETDWIAVQAKAVKSGKPVLIYFTAPWCAPCQELKATLFANKNVFDALTAYIPAKIEVDNHKDLVQKYSVSEIPFFVITSASGELRRTLNGVYDSDDFVRWLKREVVLTPGCTGK
jgi:thiol:disulfide interchange protein